MSGIDREIAYRYMGVKAATDELESIMDSMENELVTIATPRMALQVYPAVKEDGYYRLQGTDISLKSEDINRLFIDVEYIAMSAVTLGVQVDRRVEYYARTSAVRMMALDALASVYTEQIADRLTENLADKYAEYKLTVRYSCGYGDLDLHLQPTILATLGADKSMGIICESGLMRPLKSMTAFQGLSKVAQPVDFDCRSCKIRECGSVTCPRRMR